MDGLVHVPVILSVEVVHSKSVQPDVEQSETVLVVPSIISVPEAK